MNPEKYRRAHLDFWIPLGVAALYLAANYAIDKYQKSVKQRQSDEFWAGASTETLSVFAACNPGGLNIKVPAGWAIKSLARESGLAGNAELFGFELPAPITL